MTRTQHIALGFLASSMLFATIYLGVVCQETPLYVPPPARPAATYFPVLTPETPSDTPVAIAWVPPTPLPSPKPKYDDRYIVDDTEGPDDNDYWLCHYWPGATYGQLLSGSSEFVRQHLVQHPNDYAVRNQYVTCDDQQSGGDDDGD